MHCWKIHYQKIHLWKTHTRTDRPTDLLTDELTWIGARDICVSKKMRINLEMHARLKLMQNLWPRYHKGWFDNPACEKPEGRVWQIDHCAGVNVQLNVDNVLDWRRPQFLLLYHCSSPPTHPLQYRRNDALHLVQDSIRGFDNQASPVRVNCRTRHKICISATYQIQKTIQNN